MKKIYIISLLVWLTIHSFAQDSLDHVLVPHRKFITTHIKQNGIKLSYNQLSQLYKNNNQFKSQRLLSKSRYFLPGGPILVLGGIYMGYDAIKGTRQDIVIDGVNYTYYIRPIENLLAGIAIFATGICLIEYSNEFKSKSAVIFNQSRKKQEKKGEFDIGFGITPQHKFGLYAKF